MIAITCEASTSGLFVVFAVATVNTCTAKVFRYWLLTKQPTEGILCGESVRCRSRNSRSPQFAAMAIMIEGRFVLSLLGFFISFFPQYEEKFPSVPDYIHLLLHFPERFPAFPVAFFYVKKNHETKSFVFCWNNRVVRCFRKTSCPKISRFFLLSLLFFCESGSPSGAPDLSAFLTFPDLLT